MPGQLLVPQHVAENDLADRLNAETDEQVRVAKELRGDLKGIDPTLDLVWVPEGADDPELVPARWHIRKRIPGDVNAYIPLIGPDGSYREPGAWVLDWLNESDMWNPAVHRSKREAKDKLREAKTRAAKRQDEQRQDVMAEAMRAAKRIRGDGGMTQRTDLKLPPKIATEKKAAKDRQLLELPPGVEV